MVKTRKIHYRSQNVLIVDNTFGNKINVQYGAHRFKGSKTAICCISLLFLSISHLFLVLHLRTRTCWVHFTAVSKSSI